MKKIVVFLVMAAMLFSLAGTAFAADFSDVKDLNKDVQGSIAKLNGLNVINGYPDGSFKPGNTITRAEFAKIAIIIGGLEKSADVLKDSPTKFKDVAVGQWYTGWINLAASQDYVKGFPDGTFRPNAKISYAQVVTVLLRVLGYNDNLPGPWPVDYIAKAGSLDITEDVAFAANSDSTRADVAVMADATLDATVVEWDNDKEDFVKTTNSLLEENFEAAVNNDYLITDAKHDDGTWSIKVEKTDADEKLANGWYDLAEGVIVSDGSLPTDLGNKIADILYNEDDEVVAFIDVTSTKVTVDGEDWSYDDAEDEFEINDVTYDEAENFVSGPKLADYDDNAVYRAYINADDEVYMVSLRPVTTPAVVDEYKAVTEKVTFTHTGTYFDKSSIDFTDEDVLIEKGGKFVTAEELKENDVVYVDADAYGYDYYIYATTVTATGTFQSLKTGAPAQVKIDGVWYDVAADTTLSRNNGADFDDEVNTSGLEDTYGDTIKYFLNKSNQVCIVLSDVDGIGDDSNTLYGVVTDIVSKNSVNNKLSNIKVMKKDGTEASYTIDTDEVELLYSAAAGNDANELDVDDFIKFSVNENNEIDSLTILAYWDSNAPTGVIAPDAVANTNIEDYVDADNVDYIGDIQLGDTDNNRVKFEGNWYYITDNTVVFNGNLDDALGSDDDESAVENNGDVVDWAEGLTADVTAYVQYDGNEIEYIYLHNEVAASSDDYAVVLDSYVVDGDKWVDVDIKGETKSFEMKNQGATINEGTMYEYSLTSSKFDTKTTEFNPDTFKIGAALDTTKGVSGSVAGKVYAQVTDVKTASKAVEINGVWFFADEDTIIYDYSDFYDDGDDPVFSTSLADINEDDFIIFVDNGDGENVAKYFLIVNNID